MQTTNTLPSSEFDAARMVALDRSNLHGESEEAGFDVRLLLAIIRGNSILITTIILGSLAIAIVMTMLTTPRYTASTTVQIDNQTAQVLGKAANEDTNSSDTTSAGDTERFLQTQMDILNSRALATRVAERLNLVGNPAFYAAMGARAPAPGKARRKLEEETLRLLLNNETGALPRNSRLATITFTATDPGMAAKIANTWAQEFIQANLQRRYDSSAYARDFISGQLAEAKAKLEKSERDLNGYARAAGLIKTRDPGNSGDGEAGTTPNSVTMASLLQQNAAANAAEQNRILAEQRWQSVSRSNLLTAPEVLTNPTISSLMIERAKVAADLQSERSRHLEDYPSVQKLKAQEATINHQINDVAKSVRDSIKQQYDAAMNAEQSLKQQVTDLKGASLAEQDRSVEYNLLARDADTNRSLYENLLQRYKELSAAAGITASNISIIDTADNPIEPSAPKLMRNLAIAFLAGVVLAALVVTVRHQTDDSVRVPEDIERKLGVPLLGVIPVTNEEVPLAELQDPKSPFSEGYHSLRNSLMFSTPHGLPKTLLVTSSQPAEGKSTSSFAIAQGIAKLGRSVVLIDVDMRRPSLHGALGTANKIGLSSLLTRQHQIVEALVPTPIENLTAMTSGPIPPSPTDLLSSEVMKELLHDLSERFDVVVLDSPPVLGLADAPLLSTMVEGVVMIIQADRGRRGSLKSSLHRLRGIKANILGGVLTMFDASKATNRYSEYYGYDYYQYRESEKA